MGRLAETCRHDVTLRSACKLCKAEDARMRRGPPKPYKPPKEPVKIRRKRLLAEIHRLNEEWERKNPPK